MDKAKGDGEEGGGGGATYTVEGAVDAIGFGWFQVKLVSVVGLVFVADAMEVNLLSFLGPVVQCEFGVSPEAESLLTTLVFVGMMLGSYIWGVAADRYGRNRAMLGSVAISLLFGIGTAFATNFLMLLVMRMGVGAGIASFSVAFAYFMEYVPTRSRGFWGLTVEVFWSLGVVLETGFAWLILPRLGWRYLVGATSLPLLVMLLAYPTLPRSSRFESISGRREAAQAVLEDAARQNGRPLPEGELGRVAAQPRTSILTVFSLIFGPAFRHTTLCLWLITFLNAFAYYGVIFLTVELSAPAAAANATAPPAGGGANGTAPCDANRFSEKDFFDILITSSAELPGLAFSVLIIDRVGRRYTQAIQFAIFALCMGLLLLVPAGADACIALLFIARAVIMGAFSTTVLYTPEVYPTVFRASASGLCNSFSRLGGMVAPFVGTAMPRNGHAKAAAAIFAAAGGVAVIASLMLRVETAGQAMSDVKALVASSSSPSVLGGGTAPGRSLARAGGGATAFQRLRGEEGEEDEARAAAAPRGSRVA
jgi:MFS family permease